MREIKFRAWDKENEVMADVDFFSKSVIGIKNAEFEDIENFILLQFTGLHDKNGKEIYENDIVKIDGMNCVIKYSDLSASYIAECIGEDTYWDLGVYTQKLGIELIGNVFEDGELIASNN